MKKIALALITLVSIGAQAQFPGPFRPHHPGGPGGPGWGRPEVRCVLTTEHGHTFYGSGPSCMDARQNAAADCAAAPASKASRCYNAAAGQSSHYSMQCDSGC